MKSRYICMFACLWGLGFLFSCDGFLNENPKDKIPEEDAYIIMQWPPCTITSEVTVIARVCRGPAEEFTI